MTTDKPTASAINFGTGFLPIFGADFLSAFGERSELARATSDLLPKRLAGLMDRAGKPRGTSPVAELSDDPAVDCLRE